MNFSQTEETGALCLKVECPMVDIDCILNRTLSIQYQHLSIPSIDNLDFGPLTLINIQPMVSQPYPSLHFSIEEGNPRGNFDIHTDPTVYNSGMI